MNRVELRGGITKDPEIRVVGTSILVEWTMAVNGARFDSETQQQVVKSIFVTCQAWGELAQGLVDDYDGLHRGDEVHIVGELDQQKRAGREDDRPSTRVVAVSVDLLRSPHLAGLRANPQGQDEGTPF